MDEADEVEVRARVRALTSERTRIIDSDGGVMPDEVERLAEVEAQLEALGVRFASAPEA